MTNALAEVEDTRTDQEGCSDEQEPRPSCDYRSLHCFLNFARITSRGDLSVLGKECSEWSARFNFEVLRSNLLISIQLFGLFQEFGRIKTLMRFRREQTDGYYRRKL